LIQIVWREPSRSRRQPCADRCASKSLRFMP
jgi:hypothetical protein